MTNHILIIDDDETVRIGIALFLKKEGYVVSAAGTGQEGLSILGKEKVDLLLLDLNLPDGDGLSVEQQVREKFSVPIIIVTARTGQDDKLLALGLGANEYLTKPVDEKELLLRVRNLISLAGKGVEATSPGQMTNALGIEKALSLQVRDFLERARTSRKAADGTGRGRYGTLFKVLAIIAVITAGGGGAIWFFGPMSEPPVAPEQTPGAPEKASSGAPVDTAKERTEAGEPAQTTLEKKRAEVSVDLPGKQLPKPTAEERSYEWALKSKCDPLPDVEWWKYKTHESIAAYVDQKHDGDWKVYMNNWYRRLLKLQGIESRKSGAKTSTGVVLKGDELNAYIDKMRIRLSIIRCLAQEAKEFSSGK